MDPNSGKEGKDTVLYKKTNQSSCFGLILPQRFCAWQLVREEENLRGSCLSIFSGNQYTFQVLVFCSLRCACFYFCQDFNTEMKSAQEAITALQKAVGTFIIHSHLQFKFVPLES